MKLLSHIRLFAMPWTSAYQGSSIHGIFQARILEWVAISFSRDGHNKGQKWNGPTEAEDIQKRQEYRGELYKISLNDLDNHDSVVSHLEPDILEYEFKWALGRITMNKASGGEVMEFQLSYLKS